MQQNLDDPKIYAAMDPNHMGRSIATFPYQLEKGWEISGNLKALERVERSPSSILISGMGGSAIGGDLFRDLMRFQGFEVEVNRSYSLPPAGTGMLHIAISYSGNTEETLSATRKGIRKGIPTVAITSGGELYSYCRSNDIPVISIPSGLQPRASLGYIFSSILGISTVLGVHDFSDEIMDSIQDVRTVLSSIAPEVPAEDNVSKQTAMHVGDRTPLIIATSELSSVSLRMKTQFNENSKRFAWRITLPESNHNDWIPLMEDVTLSGYACILLEPIDAEPLLQRRVRVVEELLSRRAELLRIASSGSSQMSRMLTYVARGDMASYYLAILHSIDPWPVHPIEELKRALASSK